MSARAAIWSKLISWPRWTAAKCPARCWMSWPANRRRRPSASPASQGLGHAALSPARRIRRARHASDPGHSRTSRRREGRQHTWSAAAPINRSDKTSRGSAGRFFSSGASSQMLVLPPASPALRSSSPAKRPRPSHQPRDFAGFEDAPATSDANPPEQPHKLPAMAVDQPRESRRPRAREIRPGPRRASDAGRWQGEAAIIARRPPPARRDRARRAAVPPFRRGCHRRRPGWRMISTCRPSSRQIAAPPAMSP